MPLSPEEKEELRAELADARRILREDKILAHQRLMDERWTRTHGPDPAPDAPVDPNVPPAPDKKDPAEQTDPPKKKSFYWGEALDA
jgi:hypothetical protein